MADIEHFPEATTSNAVPENGWRPIRYRWHAAMAATTAMALLSLSGQKMPRLQSGTPRIPLTAKPLKPGEKSARRQKIEERWAKKGKHKCLTKKKSRSGQQR